MRNFFNKIFIPALFCADATLLWFQLTEWHYRSVGLLLFVAFIMVVGEWWRRVFAHVFAIKKKTVLSFAYAWSAVVFLLGFSASILITWHRLTTIGVFVCYISVGLISGLVASLTHRHRYKELVDEVQSYDRHFFDRPVFSRRLIFPLTYIVVWCIGLFALIDHTRATSVLLSPWQTLPPYFLPVMFVALLLLGILVFSYYHSRAVLLFIIMYGALLHLYLPLSHVYPWGADVWRHMSIERQVAAGSYIYPVLIGDTVQTRDLYGIGVPQIFFQPQKYAYGQLWGTSVLLSETLNVDLLIINIWLVPVLSSLLMPCFLFYIGRILFRSQRAALFLSWLSFIPFSLQAVLSLSLPVSLGLLVFLFTLSLSLVWMDSKSARQGFVVLFFSVLMWFGYPLYAICMWVAIMLKLKLAYIQKRQSVWLRGGLIVVLAVAGICIIPVIEIISGSSHLPSQIDWMQRLTRLVGEWSGWYYASLIRTHDIVSGNILFNHTPISAFVSSPFTSWRWYIPGFLLLFYGTVVYGFVRAWKRFASTSIRVLSLLLVSLMGGYILSWCLLDGDHLLARRADALIATFLILFFVTGLHAATDIAVSRYKHIVVLLLVFIFSWFGMTAYASGPDMRTMSADEYQVAKIIWEQEKSMNTHCVMADTWPLLALETESSGKIIGGGFPMDYQFAQPERVALFNAMMAVPTTSTIQRALAATHADHCWFVGESKAISPDTTAALTILFGTKTKPVDVGSLQLWREGLK